MSKIDTHNTPSGTIDHDLSCMTCGYNLRSLAPDGTCPECGADIARSTQGDLLKFAEKAWLRKLTLGAALVQAGVISLIVFAVLVIFSAGLSAGLNRNYMGIVDVLASVITWASLALWMWGLWLFTLQDPRVSITEQGWSSRRIARTAMLVAVAATLTWNTLPSPYAFYAMIVSSISLYLVLLCCLLELRMIARRIPDQALTREALRGAKELAVVGILLLLLLPLKYWSAIPNSFLSSLHPGIKVCSPIASIAMFLAVLRGLNTLTKLRAALKRVLDDAGTA